MLRFLMQSRERSVGAFSEAYVKALKDVFLEAAPEAEEPAAAVDDPSGGTYQPIWRLLRIEAEGFGGVNAAGGQPFVLELAGSSICVEGYNGQGKTSLASILAVGLTGHRIGQHGPSLSACQPSAARDATNRRATAKWLPAVAYPATFQELAATEPRALVRLTFVDQGRAMHTVEARIMAQGLDPPRPSLPPGVPELLVELAILMPNRIPHLRIGEDTRLVEVLVQLIGLDPLRMLGEHVAALCHGSKNFAGFPKTTDIKKAKDGLITALQRLGEANPALVGVLDVQALCERANADADVTRALEVGLTTLRRTKAELFVAAVVDAGLDLTKREDQAKLQQAAGRLQTKLDAKYVAALPAMQFLKTLNALSQPDVLEAVGRAANAAEVALLQAEQDLKDFADQFSASLREDRDLELVLSAARQRALDVIATHLPRLPPPPRPERVTTTAAAEEAELCGAIAEAKRLSALITWWPTVQPGLAALREATLGRKDGKRGFGARLG